MGYDNKGYQGRGRQDNRNYGNEAALPDGYLKGGYYSDEAKEKLKKEYIAKYPKEIANALDGEGDRDANKRTQLRKFYEYVLKVEKKMTLHNNDFTYIEAELEELLPYVTYAKKRKLVTDIFVKFIQENVKQLNDEKDLKAFKKHFEALIAYLKKD